MISASETLQNVFKSTVRASGSMWVRVPYVPDTPLDELILPREYIKNITLENSEDLIGNEVPSYTGTIELLAQAMPENMVKKVCALDYGRALLIEYTQQLAYSGLWKQIFTEKWKDVFTMKWRTLKNSPSANIVVVSLSVISVTKNENKITIKVADDFSIRTNKTSAWANTVQKGEYAQLNNGTNIKLANALLKRSPITSHNISFTGNSWPIDSAYASGTEAELITKLFSCSNQAISVRDGCYQQDVSGIVRGGVFLEYVDTLMGQSPVWTITADVRFGSLNIRQESPINQVETSQYTMSYGEVTTVEGKFLPDSDDGTTGFIQFDYPKKATAYKLGTAKITTSGGTFNTTRLMEQIDALGAKIHSSDIGNSTGATLAIYPIEFGEKKETTTESDKGISYIENNNFNIYPQNQIPYQLHLISALQLVQYPSVTINMMGNPLLQCGDVVTVETDDYYTDASGTKKRKPRDGIIISVAHSYSGALSTTVTVKLFPSTVGVEE